MGNLVFVQNNQVVTDSLTVAEVFGKEHKHVVRDINTQVDKLEEVGEVNFIESNFGLEFYKASNNMQAKKFTLSEDAFLLIAMSYTTPEAMKMKVKFIQEFKRIKEELINSQTPKMTPLQMIHTMTDEMIKQDKRLESLEDKVNNQLTLDFGQQRMVQNAKNKRVYQLWNTGKINTDIMDTVQKVHAAIGRDLKNAFAVNSFRDIRKHEYEEAISYINAWRPSLV